MNRKSFIRNLFGATAAVVIGKKLPVPKYGNIIPGPPVDPKLILSPSIESSAFRICFPTGWITKHSILKSSDGTQWYVGEKDGKLYMDDVFGKRPRMEITEMPYTEKNKDYVRICSMIPEDNSTS